jgi:D-aminopeptidase
VRLRELGVTIGDLEPGPLNAITDVEGVRVGHVTLVEGEGPLRVGHGPVRTGVTVIVPSDSIGREGLFAGCHRLNGNGELTGLEWVRESGLLGTPVAITNTNSVGVVRDALISWEVRRNPSQEAAWSLPVVGETWDGMLNDINGFHVRPEHAHRALDDAVAGPVPEGNVGGGTGMICHGFKGGIGTASRHLAAIGPDGYTVGVLVQANHGARRHLSVAGVPVGREIPLRDVPIPAAPAGEGSGSIIAIAATDAPLLPNQCERVAQRIGLGIARVGGLGFHSSGDLFLCFSTANRGIPPEELTPGERVTHPVEMLSNALINPVFEAAVEATEEAILNALVAAQTMTGRDGITAHALPHDRLLQAMARYGRPSGGPG